MYRDVISDQMIKRRKRLFRPRRTLAIICIIARLRSKPILATARIEGANGDRLRRRGRGVAGTVGPTDVHSDDISARVAVNVNRLGAVLRRVSVDLDRRVGKQVRAERLGESLHSSRIAKVCMIFEILEWPARSGRGSGATRNLDEAWRRTARSRGSDARRDRCYRDIRIALKRRSGARRVYRGMRQAASIAMRREETTEQQTNKWIRLHGLHSVWLTRG